MSKKSLKRRFCQTLILPILLSLLAVGVAAFFSARHEIEEVYDAELARNARLMLALMRHEVEEGEPDMQELQERFGQVGHTYEKHIALRIWQGEKLFYQSGTASDFGPQHVIAGFSNKEIGDSEWRFFVLPDAGSGLTVEAAEDAKVRLDIIHKILYAMFGPVLALLLIIPPLFWLGLRRGLRPLVQLSEDVAARTPDDLTALSEEKTPEEILPLTQAVNRLLIKLQAALTKERRFTDLAAHELKTPLAVIKTLTQSAQRSTDPVERQKLLADLNTASDRATAMTGQLLALARLEQVPVAPQSISLNEAVRDVARDMLPLALQKNIQVEFVEDAEARVAATPDILAIATRNLLDNAIKYTPQEGRITLWVQWANHDVTLSVMDSGPGIPEEKLSLVTERFYRVPGNEQTGAGLGLAIVARAAEVMNATFMLSNRREGGLCATLTWTAA